MLKTEPYDLVIGSRYVGGGSTFDWNKRRAQISDLATRLSRLICKADIADPMSGFFMMRRSVFEGAMRRLSGQGFKILLDLLASSPRPIPFKELHYDFRPRQHGESKLNSMVAWEFGMLIADKLIGHLVPVRFALFAFIGCFGLVIQLAVLWVALTTTDWDFAHSSVGRGDRRDRIEFSAQQFLHLSRPAPPALAAVARPCHLLRDLQHRRGRQCRRRRLCLPPAAGLVARRRRRGARWLGVELRGLRHLHLEAALGRGARSNRKSCTERNSSRRWRSIIKVCVPSPTSTYRFIGVLTRREKSLRAM